MSVNTYRNQCEICGGNYVTPALKTHILTKKHQLAMELQKSQNKQSKRENREPKVQEEAKPKSILKKSKEVIEQKVEPKEEKKSTQNNDDKDLLAELAYNINNSRHLLTKYLLSKGYINQEDAEHSESDEEESEWSDDESEMSDIIPIVEKKKKAVKMQNVNLSNFVNNNEAQ